MKLRPKDVQKLLKREGTTHRDIRMKLRTRKDKIKSKWWKSQKIIIKNIKEKE